MIAPAASGYADVHGSSAYRELPAAGSPLAAYEALYGSRHDTFLYESLESCGARGRYSFIGGRPRVVMQSRGRNIQLRRGAAIEHRDADPMQVLRELVPADSSSPAPVPFSGGAVGCLAYDIVRQIESLPDANPDDLHLPDSYWLFPDEVVVFDHLEGRTHICLYGDSARPDRMDEIADTLARCPAERPAPAVSITSDLPSVRSTMTRPHFEAAVERAREYIRAGDIFQVVLSQRFEFPVTAPPLALYRALRITNPSPYMYFLNLDGHQVLGSSPEILARLTRGRVTIRPLAGTRPRGETPTDDTRLEHELRGDAKESAEHLMLVDLARNDIGAVCDYGSVRATELMGIERFSRVMHIVSNVEGRLRDGRDAIDLVRSTFPAGTVSGAPKIRAMQIIDELEPVRRGLYGGAIGYFSSAGDMDLCLAIRTMILRSGRGFIQAGAGIVADSCPAREYDETLNKARGLLRAVQAAGGAA